MLTTSQSLILLGQQLSPDSALNNMAFAFTFREAVDVERMRRAFASLIKACDAMRMVLHEANGQTTLRVLPSMDFELPLYDNNFSRDATDYAGMGMRHSVRQVFDLERRLFDAVLYKNHDDHFVLYLNQHHLITDGWGYAVQFDYLLKAYRGEDTPDLPAFTDYIARAAAARESDKNQKYRREWADRVADYPTPPALFGRVNADRSTESVRIVRQLTEEQTARLRAACQEPDVRAWTTDLALFNIFLTAVFAYVARVSGQHDLVIGAPAHNRVTAADKKTPGLFMELFPLRATLDPQGSLADVLEKVKIASMEFLRNARPGTSSAETGRSFNVLLNFINQAFHGGEHPVTTDWLHSGEMEPGHHFRMQVCDFDAADRLTLCFDLNTAVIEPEFHTAVVNDFMDLLWQVVEDRSTPLHAPGRATKDFLTAASRAESADPPTGLTVLDLTDHWVKTTPEVVAVRYQKRALTYAELDRRANQVASALVERGTERGDVVPVCLERSEHMITALLGILKAGAAYLPVDPSFPEERIAFLGADAGAKVWITGRAGADRVGAATATKPIVLSDEWGQSDVANFAASSPPAHLRPRPGDLIYVIYTSGSTGKPKGVMNQHDGVVNHLENNRRLFVPEGEKPVVLQKTTFTFDVSVRELFLPLISGGELVFAEPGGEKDADYLRRTVREYGVTLVHFVPPMLEIFLLEAAELPSLQTVVCSGEALLPEHVNTFRARYPGVALHNLYGPTEAAIEVTHWRAPAAPVKRVPIGRVLPNVRLGIYGPEGQPRPVGVPGELYLGGVQVARGYLNRPELTAEKFIDHDGHRWYRTGDLVRWLPDGNVDFLGRIDHQVKLRGYRIELGEIDARLTENPAVRQAVTLLRKDGRGEPALVAYVVNAWPVTPQDLRAFLADLLPGYMVPTVYVFLDQMPLLANGKINRKALPAPATGELTAAGDAPRGDFEEMLHEAWTAVFQLDSIGRAVHFLDLGGHSLTGIRLVNRINEAFQLQLPANFVFRFPDIAAQATEIERTIRELMAAMDKS